MKLRVGKVKLLKISLLVLCAWTLLAPLLAAALIVEKPLEKADAIYVLSGSSVYLQRTEKAAELYRAGVAPKIIIANDGGRGGWDAAERTNPLFSELSKKNLVRLGVPADRVEIIEEQVTGTIWEARRLRAFADENPLRSVLLVTSAHHSRRSLWTFSRLFADTPVEIGIVNASPGKRSPHPYFWWLSPRGWDGVAGEYLKFVYYLAFT